MRLHWLRGARRRGQTGERSTGRLDRRKASDEALFEPAEMSQAAQYTPAGPEQPARRRGRTRLLLVPLGIVVLLLAIPGGAYAFSQNRLSQAQASEASSAYAQALREYATVEAFAGNPVSRVLLGELADRAQVGTAETHFLWYVQQVPADYPNALVWYQNLVKDFPDSPEAKQAQASALPQTLYNAGLAFVQQLKYQQARDAMTELVQNYPKTSWATQAKAALAAKQPLTGLLIVSDQNPAPVANRLVRIATKWRIVKAHTYDDAGGPTYNATTDAAGNFSVVGGIPPGQNYLITWWDPARKTFVTTFLSDNVPVNTITINPLEPAHTTVATS